MKEIITNSLAYANDPVLWDETKEKFLKNIKYYKNIIKNIENLFFKRKIKFIELINIFHFDYDENNDTINLEIFETELTFQRNDKQRDVQKKLLSALILSSKEIGKKEMIISERESFINILTNKKNKLIIGNVIPQLSDEILTDLFIEIVRKKGEYYHLLFNVFEHLKKIIKNNSLNSHISINDKKVFQFIRKLNPSLYKKTDEAFRKMKSEYSKFHNYLQRTG